MIGPLLTRLRLSFRDDFMQPPLLRYDVQVVEEDPGI
jgi:hypothetical protein